MQRMQRSSLLLSQGVGNGATSTEIPKTWQHLTDMVGHRVPIHILLDEYQCSQS